MKALKMLIPALAVLLVAVIVLVPTMLSNRQLRKQLDAKGDAPQTTAAQPDETKTKDTDDDDVPFETTTRAARENLIALGWEQFHVWADADGRAYLSMNNDPNLMDANTRGRARLILLYSTFTDCHPRGYQDYLGGTTLRGVDLGLENVVAVYSYNLGNGGEQPFFFVDADGGLYALSTMEIYSSGKLDLKRLNIEDVAYVMPGDMDVGSSPCAVKRDGTEVQIYDLMK